MFRIHCCCYLVFFTHKFTICLMRLLQESAKFERTHIENQNCFKLSRVTYITKENWFSFNTQGKSRILTSFWFIRDVCKKKFVFTTRSLFKLYRKVEIKFNFYSWYNFFLDYNFICKSLALTKKLVEFFIKIVKFYLFFITV